MSDIDDKSISRSVKRWMKLILGKDCEWGCGQDLYGLESWATTCFRRMKTKWLPDLNEADLAHMKAEWRNT